MALRVAVIGAGSWGTALAKLLGDHGAQVRLCARRAALVRELAQDRANEAYLPGVHLPDRVEPTSELAYAVSRSDLVVCVVPLQGLRSVLGELRPSLPGDAVLVTAAKGIEQGTLQLPVEVATSSLPDHPPSHVVHMSGPSFAREVAMDLPTAVVVAGHDADVLHRVQRSFASERFRVYTTEDVVGVELGGALKNVIAIAVGCSEGLGFGHNARAALITRGLAEIARLGDRLGAHPLTLSGLSGMGDLVLTCTGQLSRNRHVGVELGRGRSLEEVLAQMTMVAEGVATARGAYELAARERVEMPIVAEVYRVLYEGKSPHDAVASLLGRPMRPERG